MLSGNKTRKPGRMLALQSAHGRHQTIPARGFPRGDPRRQHHRAARAPVQSSGAGAVLRFPARGRRRTGPLSEGARVLPPAGGHNRPREVRGARQDDDGQRLRAGADQLTAEPGALRSARRDQPAGSPTRAACRMRRRSSWRPRASRSTSSTRPSTRPKCRTARRSSPSRTGWRRRPRRSSARFSTTQWCCSCRRRIPTASISSSITGTRRRARRSIAPIPTCTTSTSATTTTATGSCSRRKRRG